MRKELIFNIFSGYKVYVIKEMISLLQYLLKKNKSGHSSEIYLILFQDTVQIISTEVIILLIHNIKFKTKDVIYIF